MTPQVLTSWRAPAQYADTGEQSPLPLLLQRRAPDTLRRHLMRALVRGGVLAAADIMTLVVLRVTLHAVRDRALLGVGIGESLAAMIPRNTFPMLQLLAGVGLGLLLFGTYRAGDARRDPARVACGALLGVSLAFWGRLWTSPEVVVALGFLLSASIAMLALSAERLIVDAIVTRVRPESRQAFRTLIVGDPLSVESLRTHRLVADRREFRICGTLTIEEWRGRGSRSITAQLFDAVADARADTVLLTDPFDPASIAAIAEAAETAGCQILAAPMALLDSHVEPKIIWWHDVPVLQMTRPARRGQHLVIKRIFDVVAAGCALILLSPLLLVVAGFVRATSRGPVIFRQQRVGLRGRLFWLYKFRSMHSGAEQRLAELADASVYSDGRLFKLPHDPRVTGLGRWLRRTSIDELPQFWNVLRGEMSLVGPRPPLPGEVAHYEEHHFARFEMLPGLTGPWQVNGRNRVTDFEQVVALERAYLRQWSLWKDLEILLRTVPVVLRMDGAH